MVFLRKDATIGCCNHDCLHRALQIISQRIISTGFSPSKWPMGLALFLQFRFDIFTVARWIICGKNTPVERRFGQFSPALVSRRKTRKAEGLHRFLTVIWAILPFTVRDIFLLHKMVWMESLIKNSKATNLFYVFDSSLHSAFSHLHKRETQNCSGFTKDNIQERILTFMFCKMCQWGVERSNFHVGQ